MKTICIIAVIVLVWGCSRPLLAEAITEAEAAECAWVAMENTPADSEAISRLIETKKLRIEKVQSDGRDLWRVIRTGAPPPAMLVPAYKQDGNTAIAVSPDTHWVALIDITNGDVVYKHRPATR